MIKVIMLFGIMTWGVHKYKAETGQCPEFNFEGMVLNVTKQVREDVKDDVKDSKLLQIYVDEKLKYNEIRMRYIVMAVEKITRCELWW